MGLLYNILWVDDRIDEYKMLEIDREIESYVRELFFEPHLYMYENVEDAEKDLKSRRYDVIFSDFNISENKSGEDFINYIRKQNVNTEVLFYSAKQDLPIISLDRISFLNLKRDASYDELKKKMISLIDLTIEKLNDLTSLRGLVMAETSELDKNMEDVCYRYFVQNKTDISDHIFEEVIKSLEKDYLNKLEKSNNCDKKCSHKIRKLIYKENIITNIAFDSSRKARSVKKIIKEKIESIISFCGKIIGIILGTITCLNHNFLFSFWQISTNSQNLSIFCPVICLYSSLSTAFTSRITRSTYFKISSYSPKPTPAVSKHV